MAAFEEFTDPRLVAIYDAWGPNRTDTDFYVELAAELRAASVVDVGCGTGFLAVELARRGHRVTGVDPSPTMIDYARRRPDGGLVRWIVGDAGSLGEGEYDLATLTGHVAQIVAEDDDWHRTLEAVHRALTPGGRIAFESRNPAARAWETWTPDASRERLDGGELGPVETWCDATAVAADRVAFELHYRFDKTGLALVSHGELRFRTEDELRRSLADAGFAVEHVYGDWSRSPLGPASPEFVVVARRA